MIRLLCFIPIIFSLHAFAQDTLAVIETTKYGDEDIEVFSDGDSTLIQLQFKATNSAKLTSIASWYYDGKKIADVDLKALSSSRMLGIKNIGSSTFFYTYEGKGKKGEIIVYRSDSFGPATQVSNTLVSGVPSRSFDRHGKVAICFWENKTSTVHVFEFKGAETHAPMAVKIPLDLKSVKEGNVSFFSPGSASHITSTGVRLKLFFDGDMLGAVYDDIWEEYLEEKNSTLFKTHVFRKNLATGEEDIDAFFSTERFAFKGFLHKNNLYRFASEKDQSRLTVHDLDNNKVSYELPLKGPKPIPGFEKVGHEHQIQRVNTGDFSHIMSLESNVGIIVHDHNDKVLVTMGYINQNKGQYGLLGAGSGAYMLIGLAATIIANSMIEAKDDPNYTRYTNLYGSPAGLNFVPDNRLKNHVKSRIDKFEVDNFPPQKLCYSAHFPRKDYWITVYKECNSARYIFMKFRTP